MSFSYRIHTRTDPRHSGTVPLCRDKGYEGLFVGENKIIAIEHKNYINGESQDIK